jgi:rhodanese-related sulfurtransferase
MKTSHWQSYVLIFVILQVLLISCTSDRKTESTLYDAMLQMMLSDDVPIITIEELKQIPDSYYLIDVREAVEFSVSRIEGAILIPLGERQTEPFLAEDFDSTTTIVVYCSVGYRSEKFTEILQKNGYQNVRNLYGGIFEWVNRGYPVVDDSGLTERIHAYSPFWGVWLQKGEKVMRQ